MGDNEQCTFANVVDIANRNRNLAAAAMIGMGLLCGMEMYFMIHVTFRRRRGLYFWSIIVANTTYLIANICAILLIWPASPTSTWIGIGMEAVAYLVYVPAEFLVLYCRLHLLATSRRTLRIIVWAIVLECLFVELPTSIFQLGAAILPKSKFASVYNYVWKTEGVVYTLLDFWLTTTYVIQIRKMWRNDADEHVKSVLRNVLYMAFLLISIDIAYITLGYTINITLMIGVEGFLFAFKLKMEIWTLNQLTNLSKRNLVASNNDLTERSSV